MQIYFAYHLPTPYEKKRRPLWAIGKKWPSAEIVDVDTAEHLAEYEHFGINYCLDTLIPRCQILVAMPQPELTWSPKVWEAIQQALKLGKEIYQVNGLGELYPYGGTLQAPYRIMSDFGAQSA